MTDKIRDYKTNTLRILNTCGIPKNLFARCIGIYFILSAVHILDARQNGIYAPDMWQVFIQAYPLKMTLIWLIIYFCFVSLLFFHFNTKATTKTIKTVFELIDPLLMIGGTLFFSCSMMWRNDNFYMCIAVCLTAAVLILYGLSKLEAKHAENISAKPTAITVGFLSVIVLGFVCITAAAKHGTFRTNSYDMGIFMQMYRSMSHNLTAVTTCERDMFLSHFNIHASYILYLLVPFYALFPGADTLVIAQAAMTVSGVIPIFLIAKRRNFNGVPLLSACIIYLFSSGLLAPCYFDFHENAFLPPLLLWLMYAVERKKYLLLGIMSVLVCIVKEDAPIYVICIAVYLAIDEKSKDRIHAFIVAFASSAYYLFITNWLTANGDGSTTMYMATRFGNLMIGPEDGLIGMIGNILSNPGYFISQFVQENTLLFFLEMLLPLLFFPFITTKIHRFLLIIPFVMINLIQGATYSPAADIGYQYTFGPAALLIYLTIINISDFDTKRRNLCIITAGAISTITAFSLISGNISYYDNYREREEHFKELEACLDTIPTDASAICYITYLHHVADRDEVYMFNENDFDKIGNTVIGLKDMEKYDFYVMHCSDPNTTVAIPYLEDAGYTVFAEYGDVLIIYVSPAYLSGS